MAGIQGTGGLANEAFRAALRAQQDVAKSMANLQNQVAGATGNPSAVGGPQGVSATEPSSSFIQSLEDGMREVNSGVRASEELPKHLLTGEVGEFHEVALQLKQSDLSFRFALQVRNKLIDAYREVMRMSV